MRVSKNNGAQNLDMQRGARGRKGERVPVMSPANIRYEGTGRQEKEKGERSMNDYEEQLRDDINRLERRVERLQIARISALSTLERAQSGRIPANGGYVALAIADIRATLNDRRNFSNYSTSVA